MAVPVEVFRSDGQWLQTRNAHDQDELRAPFLSARCWCRGHLRTSNRGHERALVWVEPWGLEPGPHLALPDPDRIIADVHGHNQHLQAMNRLKQHTADRARIRHLGWLPIGFARLRLHLRHALPAPPEPVKCMGTDGHSHPQQDEVDPKVVLVHRHMVSLRRRRCSKSSSYGAPARPPFSSVPRCANVLELTCATITQRASGHFGPHFTPPGELWRNGYVESSNPGTAAPPGDYRPRPTTVRLVPADERLSFAVDLYPWPGQTYSMICT